MHSIQKIIPKKRQKILDSNHWTEITSILRLLTETDPNRKQTSAYLSLFLKAAAVTNWVRVLSFFDWLTQQIQSQNKRIFDTNFIKISFNEIKNREQVSWRQNIFRQIAELYEKLLFWRQTQTWNSWNSSCANINSVLVEILPHQHRKVS